MVLAGQIVLQIALNHYSLKILYMKFESIASYPGERDIEDIK